jgi:hypothetical protein
MGPKQLQHHHDNDDDELEDVDDVIIDEDDEIWDIMSNTPIAERRILYDETTSNSGGTERCMTPDTEKISNGCKRESASIGTFLTTSMEKSIVTNQNQDEDSKTSSVMKPRSEVVPPKSLYCRINLSWFQFATMLTLAMMVTIGMKYRCDVRKEIGKFS